MLAHELNRPMIEGQEERVQTVNDFVEFEDEWSKGIKRNETDAQRADRLSELLIRVAALRIADIVAVNELAEELQAIRIRTTYDTAIQRRVDELAKHQAGFLDAHGVPIRERPSADRPDKEKLDDVLALVQRMADAQADERRWHMASVQVQSDILTHLLGERDVSPPYNDVAFISHGLRRANQLYPPPAPFEPADKS